jgi:hypothetical protein
MRMALSILAAACVLPGCSGDAREGNGAGGASRLVGELPLMPGFYVMSDIACGQASNATLLLLLRDGISGSQDSCDFETIEQTGPTRYRVTERCGSLQADAGDAQAHIVDWEIPDDASFTSTSDAGWQRSARYCEQSTLPAPWRDNDISDLTSRVGGQGRRRETRMKAFNPIVPTLTRPAHA